MAIRSLFNQKWENILPAAIRYEDSDILTEQKVIIINRNIHHLVWGQLILMFDDDDSVSLVTSRICVSQLAIPFCLHTLGQRRRLEKEGIVCNLAFDNGIVTVTYSKQGWLERVAQHSSPSPPEQ